MPDRCITHHIRKAAARRLAEVGCSSKEIAAITGHKSLVEVERYVRAAEQRKLSQAAIRRLTDAADCQTAAWVWQFRGISYR
ncbi:tyrosine-type recombinase/integrase [Labrys okinawensis]|uniref:tyrosine-type recombinase/integrase n=1 Tax=Labrys okinawensis TaxID=346911 RepID=UPI0039BC75CF